MGYGYFGLGYNDMDWIRYSILEGFGILSYWLSFFDDACRRVHINCKFNTMIWAKQEKGWGMGNFINITPSIHYLYLTQHLQIPVYLEEPYLKDLVQDWEAIEIIDIIPNECNPTVNSRWANKYDGTCPDWANILFFVGKTRRIKSYPLNSLATYCDPVSPPLLHKDYVVFIRGSIRGREQEKDPGEAIYYHAIRKCTEMGLKCVYVGVEYDYQRWGVDFVESFFPVLGNLRAEMSYILGAKFLVTNDTGLYHVGGAYQKKGFVMWKDTDVVKNATPNGNYYISQKGNWIKDFDSWI